MILQTKGVRFDVSQKAREFRSVVGVANPRECLASEVPRPVHIGAPELASFVEAVVGGVRAEDEQQREDGGSEREGQGGDLQKGNPGREFLRLDEVVEDGDESGEQSAGEYRRAQGEDDARGEDGGEVTAVAP